VEHSPDRPHAGVPWRPLLTGLEGLVVLGPATWLALLSVPIFMGSMNRPGGWRFWVLALSWWLGAVTLARGAKVYLQLMVGDRVSSRPLLVLAAMGAVAAVGLLVALPLRIDRLALVLAVPVLVCAVRAVTARSAERR